MRKKIGAYLTRILRYIQFRLDTTRYFVDKPKFEYQPLPWIGIHEAKVRGEATFERWDAINPYISKAKSLKDIGCCVGFFCHKTTERFNIDTVGIDINERFLRIAKYSSGFVPHGEKETFMRLRINEDSVNLLPITDITILFSIWHHWVYYYGLETATMILRSVWDKTNNTMFFESGEEEVKEEFNLPFDKQANEWLHDYLKANLDSANIEIIGLFSAGSYEHYKKTDVKRTLFMINRK